MSAMTEIPANTPRPIGKTERWVPGSWNLAALVAAWSAAELAELAAPATLASVPEAVAVAVGERDETADASMVVKPYWLVSIRVPPMASD